jgi:hypothetical protein
MRKEDEFLNPNSCLSRARDEEMIFVLLGRDIAAPDTIRSWASTRIRLGKNAPTDPQIIEARACALVMESEARKDGATAVPAAVLEAYAERRPESETNKFLLVTTPDEEAGTPETPMLCNSVIAILPNRTGVEEIALLIASAPELTRERDAARLGIEQRNEELERLDRINRELLEACKLVAAYMDDNPADPKVFVGSVYPTVQRAIAKAEGRP